MLITIEGIDGVGKATQTKLLAAALRDAGKRVETISFPDYGSPSADLLKAYLAGSLGTNPADTDPYLASTFFAINRALCAGDWKEWARDPKRVLIADRYIGSNAIHQGAKLQDDTAALREFVHWLEDLECRRYRLPSPDVTFYLTMPPQAAERLRTGRARETDIHEQDAEYLRRSAATGELICDLLGWQKIVCCEGDTVLRPEEITEKLIRKLVLYDATKQD